MDERRPKRRKDKYNPYTLVKTGGEYWLAFEDGQGVAHRIRIEKELFEIFDLFELGDLSFLNEVDRHYEHSELTENSLYDRAAKPTESVEEAVMKKLQYEALHRAIQELPLVQRRRLVLYYFQGLTYSQIAELEGCKYQAVQESIYAALKKLKLFLK